MLENKTKVNLKKISFTFYENHNDSDNKPECIRMLRLRHRYFNKNPNNKQ